jgi:hypothetical protein
MWIPDHGLKFCLLVLLQLKNKNQGKIWLRMGTRGVHTTEIKLCDDWGVMAMWGRKSVPWGDLICFDVELT